MSFEFLTIGSDNSELLFIKFTKKETGGSEMTNAIEVKHIFKKYQNKPILSDICFKIKEGEIVALIGKNGAGKSTLINIVNGLIKPNSGHCMIYNQTKPDRNLMGLMLQDNFSLDRVKVKEAIQLARTYYQHPLSYEEILAISGLSTKQNNFMTQLSGGQKRSLQFALAMVGNPKIIFLDEPTSGMDPDARTHFWKYIDELKKQGKTFLITSHYLNELEKTANHFIFLHNHKIAFDGDLKEMNTAFNQVKITFISNLVPMLFGKLPAITSVREINHHYTITTNDLNTFLAGFMPYLSAINNLEIKQQSLDALMENIISNEVENE